MNNSKNRFAIFLPGLYDGGAERIVLNLAAGLCQRGHAIDLILAQSEGPFLDQIPEKLRVI
jgi:hypothetical protein